MTMRETPNGPSVDRRAALIESGDLLLLNTETVVSLLLTWYTARQIRMDREWLRLNLEIRIGKNIEITD